MGILRHRRRRISAAILLLLFISALGTGLARTVKEVEETTLSWPLDEREERTLQAVSMAGRRLIGPGSSPPTCRARCGRCFPCQPVHVTIQPGLSVPLEYYPEAWRCKCGDKLFMP